MACSWARRSFAAATICMALVIFCVAFTEAMRAKTSELERKWIADAKAKGVANPEQVIREYRAEIAKLQ